MSSNDAPEVSNPVPEWLTHPQVVAIADLYNRNPDGSPDIKQFFQRVKPELAGAGAVGLWYCGMYIGIEPDGYTHS